MGQDPQCLLQFAQFCVGLVSGETFWGHYLRDSLNGIYGGPGWPKHVDSQLPRATWGLVSSPLASVLRLPVRGQACCCWDQSNGGQACA